MRTVAHSFSKENIHLKYSIDSIFSSDSMLNQKWEIHTANEKQPRDSIFLCNAFSLDESLNMLTPHTNNGTNNIDEEKKIKTNNKSREHLHDLRAKIKKKKKDCHRF